MTPKSAVNALRIALAVAARRGGDAKLEVTSAILSKLWQDAEWRRVYIDAVKQELDRRRAREIKLVLVAPGVIGARFKVWESSPDEESGWTDYAMLAIPDAVWWDGTVSVTLRSWGGFGGDPLDPGG